jgi:hypothetical protein
MAGKDGTARIDPKWRTCKYTKKDSLKCTIFQAVEQTPQIDFYERPVQRKPCKWLPSGIADNSVTTKSVHPLTLSRKLKASLNPSIIGNEFLIGMKREKVGLSLV